MITEKGKRELKKESIRAAIVESAHELFEERGFGTVTVAEIAKKAKVSVKTLFTYFNTKEDMVFEGEFELLISILLALKARKRGISAATEFRKFITDLILSQKGKSPLAQLEGFEKMTGDPVLKSRLQMMWSTYEDRLAEYFVEETAALSDDPRPRMAAIQLISLLRLLTSREAKEHIRLGTKKAGKDALINWFEQAFRFLKTDLSEFAKN
jgi:AcrR family transcriptional regulator